MKAIKMEALLPEVEKEEEVAETEAAVDLNADASANADLAEKTEEGDAKEKESQGVVLWKDVYSYVQGLKQRLKVRMKGEQAEETPVAPTRSSTPLPLVLERRDNKTTHFFEFGDVRTLGSWLTLCRSRICLRW
jgi:hypothetical protein